MVVVGIIGGTGNQGSGIASRLAKAGLHVLIGSRFKDKCNSACMKIKQRVANAKIEGVSYREAAQMSDVLFVTVPLVALAETLNSVKGFLRRGQVVVDVTNPLQAHIGGHLTRTLGLWEGSAAQYAAQFVPKGVHVVAAFKNVLAANLHDLDKPVNSDILIAGDYLPAKRQIASLVSKIPNARPIDIGELENARLLEHFAPTILSVAGREKVPYCGVRFTGI